MNFRLTALACLAVLLVTPAEADSGFAVYLDNDVYSPGSTDEDYTFGITANMLDDKPGPRWSIDQLLSRADGIFELHETPVEYYLTEAGVLGFTPTDINIVEPQLDDRPYASLIYAGSSRVSINHIENFAITSHLVLGLLGLDVAEETQQATHEVIQDEDDPRGWENQISDGGEPTFRYGWSRRQLISDPGTHFAHWLDAGVSVGYLTDVHLAYGGKWGSSAPWWGRMQSVNGYGHRALPPTGPMGEHWLDRLGFWWNAQLSLRGYNSFLQGQFRDNPVEYSTSEVRTVVLLASAGIDMRLWDNWFASYAVYGRSSELKDGPADRHHVWGSISVGRWW